MGHALIEVPAMAGDPNHPAAAGPVALTAALADAGSELAVRRVSVGPFRGDRRAASLEIGRHLADAVREVANGGDMPLVFAGSCDVAPGVLAGLRDPELGVVWIDAHADFNTPASSASGFWPGMALAVVVGDCGEEVWSALGGSAVSAERVALFGVRSLSPEAEAQRLARSQIGVVRWQAGEPVDEPVGTLERLATRVGRVYLHLDLDALDPSIGSGVADPPVPGGLSEQQLVGLLEEICHRFSVRGASVTTYTPATDEGSTLPVALSAINALIASGQSRRRGAALGEFH
jgi:arginase